MTAYDQPGFRGAFPAAPDGLDARAGAPAGSAPTADGGDEHLADVTVSELYASTQAEQDVVSVGTGDTAGGSDLPAQASAIVQGGSAGLMDTGAGRGNPDPYTHPSAGR